MEERKKNGACSTLEYLDWYIKQESDSFTNHDGSTQVSIFCTEFTMSLQNITAKTFCMAARQIYMFIIKKNKNLSKC